MIRADVEFPLKDEEDFKLLRPIQELILPEPRWYCDQDIRLFEMGCIDQNQLHRLVIRGIESIDVLKTLANVLPMIEDLRFTRFSNECDMEELISTLQLFKGLRALRCRPIWSGLPDASRDEGKLRERVEILANALPKLCQLGHPWVSDQLIMITRGEPTIYRLEQRSSLA
ncbi:hypothetical protein BDN72DRAFT_848481 [Pluteus cervinus]|uniref:Uncharacterized protein n=1 Tax=Pluteus cervinus TaxID=181527 RepID=A0ACD3AA54_9AGAR|nr:hypothetical protein BDN72DRAFT_848481 [Pluteus cervinus]